MGSKLPDLSQVGRELILEHGEGCAGITFHIIKSCIELLQSFAMCMDRVHHVRRHAAMHIWGTLHAWVSNICKNHSSAKVLLALHAVCIEKPSPAGAIRKRGNSREC